MRKLILLLTLPLITLHASAQMGISIGAKAGLTIPKLTASGDNPMSKGYQSALSGNGGMFAEFRFSELFSLQPGIEFSQQGGQRKGLQAIPAEMLPAEMQQLQTQLGLKYLYADFESHTKFNYLMIPVLAKFGWNLGQSRFRIHVAAGPFVSFLLSAQQITSGTSDLYIDPRGDMTLDYLGSSLKPNYRPIGRVPMGDERPITKDTRGSNYGFSGNVGLTFDLAPRHQIFLEAGGNYGFVKLQKNKAHGENTIGAGLVQLGYGFKIK